MQKDLHLIEAGKTKVLCAASIENKVPSVLEKSGQRLDYCGIFDAPACHSYTFFERKRRKNRRSNHGNTTSHRPLSAIRYAILKDLGNARLLWIVM